MYFAYLYSYLNNGTLFWGNPRNLKKSYLITKKKKAIRLTENISSTTHCKPYFKKIKDYDTTFYIHVYEILLHTTMYLSRFKTNSKFHAYETRNKSDLFIY